LIVSYAQNAILASNELPNTFIALNEKINTGLKNLRLYVTEIESKRNPEDQKKLEKSGLLEKIKGLSLLEITLAKFDWEKERPTSNKEQLAFTEKLNAYTTALKELDAQLKSNKDALNELWAEADKVLKIKADKSWLEQDLNNLSKAIDELHEKWKRAYEQINYWHTNLTWLQTKFPDAKYADVVGLCKVADKVDIIEQDYSINPGRYVGVEIDDISFSIEEFREIMNKKHSILEKLNSESIKLENLILTSIKSIL
jgi:type I restriction enzyme M protein